MQNLETVLTYVRDSITRHGELRGKVVFAYSEVDAFLTHHLSTGDEEQNFLEALSVRLKFEEVNLFYLCFSGYLGEKPESDSIVLLTGSTQHDPQLSHWTVENVSGFIRLKDSGTADIVSAIHNPLNLLRPTQRFSLQVASHVLSKAAANPARYILKGL